MAEKNSSDTCALACARINGDSGREEDVTTDGSLPSNQPRLHRANTTEEKRKMRNLRKKRLRCTRNQAKTIKRLKSTLEATKLKVEEDERKITALRTRTFWEMWRWELEKRKETMIMTRRAGQLQLQQSTHLHIPEIDSSMLSDPFLNGEKQECYVGRGSFGVVKLQLYRGIFVAVKELLQRSVKEDIKNEADILAGLCYPFLPYLFGICTNSRPFKIVMQYHGFIDMSTTTPPRSHTLGHEIFKHVFCLKATDWLIVCAQILDAVNYLHSSADILHNDIKCDNIVFGVPTTATTTTTTSTTNYFQILLIDFGKATKTASGKLYFLTELEKEEYRVRYSHFAPEVIDGKSRQTTYSDMYSVGGIFYCIVENSSLK